MRSKVISPKIFAGIDNIIFDERQFDPSKEDIINICRFFSLGDLKRFEKERGIKASHSNHFVFLLTTSGEYALKFYPPDSGHMLTAEYTINRYLLGRGFLTPQMHEGKNGQPSLSSNDLLVTCFTYIDGRQAWQHIDKPQIIRQINKTMVSLKEILLSTKERFPLLKQESFTRVADDTAQASRSIPSYDQKELIESTLLMTCRSFQQHLPLFERQYLHNNSTLTNFLIVKKDIYTLDLTHIREDYILSDLAALVVSCLFLDIQRNVIKLIVEDHFKQNKIREDKIVVFNTLVTMNLIREYLKNIQRDRSIKSNSERRGAAKDYLAHLNRRKKLIVEILTKISARNMLFEWDWV